MMRSITVGPETVALGALTLLTGDAQALRSAIATLGELGAIHVDFGHDRSDVIRRAVAAGAEHGRPVTIDTLECAVHYTDLPALVRTLVEDALERDVQVIATTQSAEMLEALASADTYTAAPEPDIRVTKCGTGLAVAPMLTLDKLKSAIHAHIELR